MITINKFPGSLNELEEKFRRKYSNWLILGAKNESVFEGYKIECDEKEFSFGLGIAQGIGGITPQTILSGDKNHLFVGFDNYVAWVFLNKSTHVIDFKILDIVAPFRAMFFSDANVLCVIHENGALGVGEDLTRKWSNGTDLVSDWSYDRERSIISITEWETGKVIAISALTGEIVSSST